MRAGDADYRKDGLISVGGWKCRCCGPKPDEKPAARRRARSTAKRYARKEVRESLADGSMTCASCTTIILDPKDVHCRDCASYWKDCDEGLWDEPDFGISGSSE